MTNCLNCDLLTKNKKYCSVSCQQQYQNRQRFTTAIINDWYPKRDLQRWFLNFVFGFKCNTCSVFKWNDKNLVLEVNHIDGDSGNHSGSNLEYLCPNCHSQTNTYKAKNLGNGRFYRRKRYNEGKSY